MASLQGLIGLTLIPLLFHWRVLPIVVRFISLLLQKGLNINGAMELGAAANSSA